MDLEILDEIEALIESYEDGFIDAEDAMDEIANLIRDESNE